jgi:hypothetical protein
MHPTDPVAVEAIAAKAYELIRDLAPNASTPVYSSDRTNAGQTLHEIA